MKTRQHNGHEHDGHGEVEVQERHGGPQTPKRSVPTHPPVRSVAVWGPIAVVSVLALLVIVGVWRHMRAHGAQEQFTKETNQLAVNVIDAKRDLKPKELILPGTFQAIKQTTIYPRSNGYVQSWKADIGDNVQAGQLLAEIATPEVDQQLAQARAQEEITKVTADRWRDLVQKNVVSKQEYDQNEKAYEGARANLQQLEKIQGFQQILAPFAGKIAARNIDIGTLVTAGTGNSGTPLFSIVQSDVLRVYVFAPQENAPSIHEGLAAKIILQEYPGQEFDGKVTRTAGALDPQSRTMQVEVQVPNNEGKLFAGMYGQVKFLLANENAPIVVPANTFLFRAQGPQVATIVNEKHIHWQSIRVGRDFGDRLEVLDGLKENTKVVMNPTDDLREGTQVEVKPTGESKPASSVAQSASTK
ncbi:MAG TPA: efflux RND transporter periplasmic adaptor subunit [Candidatus Udaeobacter sp.]|nr:MAG: efflux transporter periplasmic adaptor subunit [Verrucomicrobiota bacterium]PYL33777.1 MAG: efflux transporter periplasmic adaptor subunit [Verrucomicrobiota bacterium]HMC26106.1 efflux RND transporter periplasmic adaptor subunit [Candidatus Udaeobacter sp.]